MSHSNQRYFLEHSEEPCNKNQYITAATFAFELIQALVPHTHTHSHTHTGPCASHTHIQSLVPHTHFLCAYGCGVTALFKNKNFNSPTPIRVELWLQSAIQSVCVCVCVCVCV